jgi:AcrR family transcriptional regulator
MVASRTSKYEKILSVAARLIARKGYDGTSYQEIANKVGLHKSSLFHYFKNKEQLLLRVLEKPIEEVNKNLQQIVNDKELEPEEKLEKAIDNHLTLLTEYLDNVDVYLNEMRSLSKKNKSVYLAKRKKYQGDFEKIISDMKKKGYFDKADPKVTTLGVLGMLNWVVKWYKKDGALNVREIRDTFYRVIVGGQRQWTGP